MDSAFYIMIVGKRVDGPVSECSSASKACEDSVLDREIDREEIAVYV